MHVLMFEFAHALSMASCMQVTAERQRYAQLESELQASRLQVAQLSAQLNSAHSRGPTSTQSMRTSLPGQSPGHSPSAAVASNGHSSTHFRQQNGHMQQQQRPMSTGSTPPREGVIDKLQNFFIKQVSTL